MVEIGVEAKLGERGREVVDRHVKFYAKHDTEEGRGKVIHWHVERVAKAEMGEIWRKMFHGVRKSESEVDLLQRGGELGDRQVKVVAEGELREFGG